MICHDKESGLCVASWSVLPISLWRPINLNPGPLGVCFADGFTNAARSIMSLSDHCSYMRVSMDLGSNERTTMRMSDQITVCG
jgi:hypothetical protein